MIAIRNKVNERLGAEKYNKYNELMKVVNYIDAKNIIVQFQDDYKAEVHTAWNAFERGGVINPCQYMGMTNKNYQNQIMKIIKYSNTKDLIVEFQNAFKGTAHTTYQHFKNGQVKDPYQPSVCQVGIIGQKYDIGNNGMMTLEYITWKHMIERCYDEKVKNKYPTYQDVTCCKEWLLFENFYEWLHSQENFEKWYQANKHTWTLDKDILIKGNKIYSPNTCCLVPQYVNVLFTKADSSRGVLPVGVYKNKKQNVYLAKIIYDQKDNKSKATAFRYPTIEEAFLAYKDSKEKYIQQVAQEEYEKGNITQKCYEAMMNYKIETTD